MTFDLKFYLGLIVRRLPYFVVIIAICVAVSATFAVILPPVFRAQAKLLVESPQIPSALAQSTVGSTADELLLVIKQKLVTRTSLLDLVAQFDIYPNAVLSPEIIVAEMRQRITIYVPPLVRDTGVVTVSFGASNAELSAAVTNAIVTHILAENIALRTEASGGTLAFFQQEVKRLIEEMANQNSKILVYEQSHRDALPESLEYRRTRQSAQQERLLQVNRELAGLRDRRQRLSDLYDSTGRLAPSVGEASPEQARLEQLRQELASALVLYSAQNPRIRALQTQITGLEEAVRTQLGASVGNGALTTFDLQMADIDGQIDFLAEQKGLLEGELADLDTSITATPENAIMLGELRSDYENLRVQYDQSVASLAEARMGDRIEETARGQRITVIEQASVPAYRSEPNRKLLVASGFGVGLALSAGLFLLLEFLNSTIRRPADLASTLGITSFGVIPLIETKAEIRRRRLKFLVVLMITLIGVPVLLYWVHVNLTPLDKAFVSINDWLGLGGMLERMFPSLAE